MLFKISPSKLSFLWDECPRCFWLDATGKRKRPEMPFPKMFTQIDKLQRDHFQGKQFPGIGTIDTAKVHAQSEALVLHDAAGAEHCLMISGYIDYRVLHFVGGMIDIGDFKTSKPSDESREKYWRQLGAYAWCFEHPLKGDIQRVNALRITYGDPQAYTCTDGLDEFSYSGPLTHVGICWNPDEYHKFLMQVGALCMGAEPAPAKGCWLCDLEDQMFTKARLNLRLQIDEDYKEWRKAAPEAYQAMVDKRFGDIPVSLADQIDKGLME